MMPFGEWGSFIMRYISLVIADWPIGFLEIYRCLSASTWTLASSPLTLSDREAHESFRRADSFSMIDLFSGVACRNFLLAWFRCTPGVFCFRLFLFWRLCRCLFGLSCRCTFAHGPRICSSDDGAIKYSRVPMPPPWGRQGGRWTWILSSRVTGKLMSFKRKY